MSKTIFPDKYRKKIDQEFLDNVQSMDTEDIKKRVLEQESVVYDIENGKEEDKDLTEAREKVKEFSKPYREKKAEATAKIKWCLFVLENRGVNL